MAASNYSPAPPAPIMSTSMDSMGAPRRRRERTVNTWGRSGSPKELLEEARPYGLPRYDTANAIKARMYRLLYAVLSFTIVVLLAGIASMAFEWHHGLGTALVLTGTALGIACWTVFLCSCSEGSRMFLATIVPSYFLPPAGTMKCDEVDIADKLI